MSQFKSISPIGEGEPNAVPVKDLAIAIDFLTRVLGFQLVAQQATSALLSRDEVQMGLVTKADHQPSQAGSFYFSVADVEALRAEFIGKGAKPGAVHVQTHEGKRYRLFFVRECDMLEVHNGYCFCFGQPA